MSRKHICTNNCHKCLNCGKKTFTLSHSSRRKKYCDNKCQQSYLVKNNLCSSKTPDFITKDLMQKMYLDEGKSVLFIGRKIGKSARQVSRYLKHFDIPTRPFSTEGIRDNSHWNWKGGKTEAGKLFRNRIEYKRWRKAVFERDNYTCQLCGKRGGNLQADHIKSFAYFPEHRLEIENGRTLCISCHRKTDTFGCKLLKKG